MKGDTEKDAAVLEESKEQKESVMDTFLDDEKPVKDNKTAEDNWEDELDFYDPDEDNEDVFPPGEDEDANKDIDEKEQEEKSPEPDKTTKDKSKEDDNEPSIDESLYARAEALGVSREEAQGFKNNDSLRHALNLIEKKNSPIKKEEKQEEDETKSEDDELKIELDEDEFHPELVQALKGLGPQVAAKIKSQFEAMQAKNKSLLEGLQNKIGVLETSIRTEQQIKMEKEFDGLINSLSERSESAKKVFGKGSGRDFKSDSIEMGNRIKVIKAINTIASSADGPKTMAEIFDAAVAMAFPNLNKDISTEEVRKSLQTREKSFLTKPTHRAGPPKTGYQKAIEHVGEKLKEFGVEEDDDYEEFE